MLASAAFADPPFRSGDQGRPYSIKVASEVTPTAHAAVDYPSAAALRGLSGSCEVTLDVTAAGKASAVSPACTSDHFTREAARIAAAMSFAPKAVSGAKVRIYWTIDEPAASLTLARAD